MKKVFAITLMLMMIATIAWAAGGYNTKVYMKQGGAEQVVGSGGKVTVQSGGIVDVESGGSLKIAGTAITATAAEINKLDNATAGSSTAKIYVNTEGSDTNGNGSIFAPYKTLTKAFTVVTTARKTVIMSGGDYDEAAAVVWPSVNGVIVEGIDGDVVISSAASITHVIGIDPAAASGTWSATLKNIEIDHGDIVGLQVDNSVVAKRINLYLKNFTASAGSGSSIDINRSGAAGDAIRVYADGEGNTIEGLVTVITESTDDRFRFKGYRLIGGLTVVGAVASEVTLINSGVLTSGLTVDGANKLTNVGCWYETDANPNVYTAFTNAYATY